MLNFFKNKTISKEDEQLLELFNSFYLNISDLLNELNNESTIRDRNNLIKKIYERIGYAGLPKLCSNENNINIES